MICQNRGCLGVGGMKKKISGAKKIVYNILIEKKYYKFLRKSKLPKFLEITYTIGLFVSLNCCICLILER